MSSPDCFLGGNDRGLALVCPVGGGGRLIFSYTGWELAIIGCVFVLSALSPLVLPFLVELSRCFLGRLLPIVPRIFHTLQEDTNPI